MKVFLLCSLNDEDYRRPCFEFLEIARLTTCLCDPTLPEDVAYVDTNNCPWAVAFLEENGLAEKTGRTKRSGYCVYPAMRFNREKIAQFEEEEN